MAVDSHTTQSLRSSNSMSCVSLQSIANEEEEEERHHSVKDNDNNNDEARHDHDSTTLDEHDDDNEEEKEAVRLLQSGIAEHRAGQVQDALLTWNLALDVVSHRPATALAQELLCRMISLHLQLYRTTAESAQLEAATSLVAQLVDTTLENNDTTKLEAVHQAYLESSPLLLELLLQHSLWSMALQVIHKLSPQSNHDVDPLTLARCHLEVALSDNNNGIKEGGDSPTTTTTTSSSRRRSSQLSHLSECHQLLLAFDPTEHSNNSNSNSSNIHVYQSLWQELAQAYGILGEEGLALSCSQSRMQHCTNVQDIALGHYHQAVEVYLPAGQYSLAWKEIDLALKTLQTNANAVEDDDSLLNEQDLECLWMKLYQCKADIYCRMGRIGESIDAYKILLERNRTSSQRGPVDDANVLFLLGKLSVRNKDYTGALQYFTEELQMTKSVVGHPDHLAISKILHELAHVAETGLMDFPMAVRYYQEALEVERGVYQSCKRQQEEEKLISTTSAALLKDAKNQIAETKQCLGRLHFKLGDFNQALKTTLT